MIPLDKNTGMILLKLLEFMKQKVKAVTDEAASSP